MLYTIFNDSGYIMKNDEWLEKLTNSNGYEWLFNFLKVNLYDLNKEFETEKKNLIKYLKKIEDHSLYESELNIQAKKIEHIHPFYRMNFTQKNHPFYGVTEGKKYLIEELLFCLFDELSIKHQKAEILNEVNEFKETVAFFRQENINNLFIKWYNDIRIKSRNPLNHQLFRDLIISQEKLLSWSYLLLDLDVKYLNELSKKQRISMYGFFSNSILNFKDMVDNNYILPDITVTERLYFSNKDNNVSMIDYNEKELWSRDQNISQCKVLLRLQMAYRNSNNPNTENILKLISQNFKENFKTHSYWVKEIVSPNLATLLEYEFSMLLESNLMIRKCRACGRYFVLDSLKTFYCKRINEETGKRCCDKSTKTRHIDKLKKLGIYDEYNKINNSVNYRLSQPYPPKNEEVTKKITNKRILLREKKKELIKYIDIEEAQKSECYVQFFELAEEIKALIDKWQVPSRNP